MVVPTLAIVEDPSPPVYMPIDAEEVDDDGVPKNTPAAEAGQQGLITSKIRSTVRHLRARGGVRALFRGMGVALIYNFCRSILNSIFSIGASPTNLLFRSLGGIIADVALTGLAVTWVHTVISDPATLPGGFWKRIPPFHIWKKVVPAAAIQSVAAHVSVLVPLAVAMSIYPIKVDDNGGITVPDMNKPGAIIAPIVFFFLTIALTLLIQVPAAVTMIRVAASTLSPEVETIVPFDRSFSGLVEPAVLGGGCIGLLDAWKSFGWPSRVRLVKLLAKYYGMVLVNLAVFILLVSVEVVTLAGGDLRKLIGKE